MKLLDLFCGRWGWSKAFAKRGWECVGVDLVAPPEIPAGCTFIHGDVMALYVEFVKGFDFGVASSPCEEFAIHGMKHFHPNPPYPELGLKLFNHTRQICEESGVPYVMENVRAAQKFVGWSMHHCGPFYLWGNGLPAILPQGIGKSISQRVPGLKSMSREDITAWRRLNDPMWSSSHSEKRKEQTAKAATIPHELANCVADYAERIIEQSRASAQTTSAGTALGEG